MSALVVAALILAAAPEPRRIDDAARGFSFLLPGDYVAMPGSHSAGAWVRHPEEDDFVMIALEGMSGPIARGEADLAQPGHATALKEQWKGFELDGVRVVEEREGERILVLAVQVPLAPKALQVMVSGLEQNEPAVHDALRALLGSLEGRSSWLSEDERVASTTEGALRLGVTFLIVTALGAGAWRLLRRRERSRV